MKVGLVGAGHISGKMAQTIASVQGFERYAVAARDLGRAVSFARDFGFTKAYGSYRELVDDPEVDLVYIGTPNSEHFAHASMAINAGKPVLCEKSFCVNARQTAELLELSRDKGVFITEAMLTRYLPVGGKIRELIASGAIGRPDMVAASLCYPLTHKERVVRPELGGGVLLDIGLYCLNFIRMCFPDDPETITGTCLKGEYGVDMQETVSLRYADGRGAAFFASGYSRCPRRGTVCGDEGWLEVDSVNIPRVLSLYRDYRKVDEWRFDEGNGYEPELIACCEAVAAGAIECKEMPHHEILAMMRQMDTLRRQWGVSFPED